MYVQQYGDGIYSYILIIITGLLTAKILFQQQAFIPESRQLISIKPNVTLEKKERGKKNQFEWDGISISIILIKKKDHKYKINRKTKNSFLKNL